MTGMSREPLTPDQMSVFLRASARIVPTTCVNIGPRSAPGSFGSWIFAPRNACATFAPRTSAVVVMKMSMPKRATSVSQTGWSTNTRASFAWNPNSPPIGWRTRAP